MKLSEAIRLGAMIRPQAFGHRFRAGGSCAWGAAQEAIGLHGPHVSWMDLPADWRSIWSWRPCPDLSCNHRFNYSLIAHLNDDHRWTRERIADFVTTIESETHQESNMETIHV